MKPTGPTESRRARILRHPAFIGLLLAAVTLAIYGRVAGFEFLNYDDPDYVVENAQVRAGLTWQGAGWAFATNHAGNWHPVTWLSHMLDTALFGQGAAGPHLMNLLLHAGNGVLLFLLLRQLTGAHWRSGFAAALFALHPLHVESVAWVSERKDVLSTFFGFLCLLYYARYAQSAPRVEGRVSGDGNPKAEGRRPEGKGESRNPKPERSPKSEVRIAPKREGGQTAKYTEHAEGELGRTPLFRVFRVFSRSGFGVQSSASEVQRPGCASRITHHASHYYVLALLFFALGLMCKPMLVTWPFLMLLLDYWPLRRVTSGRWRVAREGIPKSEGGNSTLDVRGSRFKVAVWLHRFQPLAFSLQPLLLEKLPFFALAAASSVITFLVQRQAGSVRSLVSVPLVGRLENAVVSYARYLGKTFWPVNLALPYPHPGTWPLGQALLAVVLAVGLCVVAVWLGRRRPWLSVGWFWFLGTLAPVIGLVQVGVQAMADRYSYVPLVGVFIILAWSAGEAVQRQPRLKPISSGAGLALLAICAVLTTRQLAYWRTSETLARHAIAVTRDNATAYTNLGNHWLKLGQLDEAIASFRKALLMLPVIPDSPANLVAVLAGKDHEADAARRGKPPARQNLAYVAASPEVLNNLGSALARKGQVDDAIECYRTVLQLQPNYAMALNNLAYELAERKDYGQAIELYTAAVRAKPGELKIRYALGDALVHAGRLEEAVAQFTEAVRRSPNDADARNRLGLALVAAGRTAEAIAQYEAALRVDPRMLEAHNNLGSALLSLGRLDDAIGHFRLILQSQPDHAGAHDNLGVALASQGQFAEAAGHFREALRLQPANADTHFNLGNVLASQRKLEAAAVEYREALRLVPDHPQAHCHLGAVLAEAGRRDEAVAHLREALRLKPDYADAREQLQALGAP